MANHMVSSVPADSMQQLCDTWFSWVLGAGEQQRSLPPDRKGSGFLYSFGRLNRGSHLPNGSSDCAFTRWAGLWQMTYYTHKELKIFQQRSSFAGFFEVRQSEQIENKEYGHILDKKGRREQVSAVVCAKDLGGIARRNGEVLVRLEIFRLEDLSSPINGVVKITLGNNDGIRLFFQRKLQ